MPNQSLEMSYKYNSFLEWWNFTRRIIFIYGIAFGINYLHQNKIIHQDLNFSNILISAKGEPKITDFLLSSLFPLDIKSISNTKLIFMAPEILEGHPYTELSDVYSFGVAAIMLMIDNMNILYNIDIFDENLSSDELIAQIKSGLLRALHACVPSCVHDLLLSLISLNPSERPEISKFLTEFESFFPKFVENEGFNLQIFTEYKDKITLAEDTMDDECKQAKIDADGGDKESMYRYAYFRSKGIGCKVNETEAWHYYQLAADQGYEKAKLFIDGAKATNKSTIPSDTASHSKINADKLKRLKEKLRNKKNTQTVVSEEKDLLLTQQVKMKLENIDSFQEFSRLADDPSFNEDPINITQITDEIHKEFQKAQDKLPNEVDREKIKESNFILTPDSESRLCKIINYIKYRIPVLLEGPTGTSKTLSAEIACQILNNLNDDDKTQYGFVIGGSSDNIIELIRFNLSSETKTKDLIGRYVGDPNSWAGISQEDGPFYKAFKYGKILLLDEINLASPSVLQCIEEALDSGILSIEIPGKPLIPIPMHPNFRLLATQNPNKGLFAHKRQDLGLKFYSRFQVINFPAFTIQELALIASGLATRFHYKERYPDPQDGVISQLVKFHKEWSEKPEVQDDAQCFTIREMAATVHALGKGSNVYDTIMTYYGSRYQEKKKNDLIEVLKNHKKLFIKGEEKPIPKEFDYCFPNEALKNTVKAALFSLENGRNIIITGREGCGKTQVALWISQYFNKVLRKKIIKESSDPELKKLLKGVDANKQFYFICTEDTKVADLVGHQSPAGKAEAGDEVIVWLDGFLTHAIKEGKCSVLESIDEAPATVTERLNGLLDQKYDNQKRYFDIPENPNEKKVLITDTFRIIATCDVEKVGFISPAFLNRFDVIVLEEQICTELTKSADDASKVSKTIKTTKGDFNKLTKILFEKYFNEAVNNRKKLGMDEPDPEYAITDQESKKISSILYDNQDVWNNILKISKACKAITNFVIELDNKNANKRDHIFDFALDLLSGNRDYKIPDEIEKKLLSKLKETESSNQEIDKKSTDPEFYFKKSPRLCSFMAKLMAFSLIQQPVCVSGATGAGKTSAARKFSRMRKRYSNTQTQFRMHSFHAGTKTSQFYGTATLKNGQIDFIKGTLTEALETGDVFIADEFNLSPQSVMKSLAPALEQTVGSNIFIPGLDQSINTSPEFFFIACQNELGTLGRNAIPETISSRFAYLDYPKPELDDLQTICEDISNEEDEEGNVSISCQEIARNVAEYMQDINSLSSPYITQWSLRDISKIFRRIRYQEKKLNAKNYIGIDSYHHILFYTLSSVPTNYLPKAIEQITPIFQKFKPDFEPFVKKYLDDFNATPEIKNTENDRFIMKGEIGVRVEHILCKMTQRSSINEDELVREIDDDEVASIDDETVEKLSKLKNLWNTAFQICLSDKREPLLLMGNSGFKTFLAQQIITNASIIPLNQETTVAQLLGSSGFFTASEAKHFYINNLCNICYEDSSVRSEKKRELQEKWQNGTLTEEDLNLVVEKGIENAPISFKYMINHLSESITKRSEDDKCVLSNTTLEFRPGLFLNAILQKKSLILKDLSNLPTIVLERFNELFSGKQNITLTEDIHNTFTEPQQKELTDFNDSFRVIGTCPANTPSKLSEAVLSRFTVIATPEYDDDERKIVLESLCEVNGFKFQKEYINVILEISRRIDDAKLKPYSFQQMIKTVQLTSMINNINFDQQFNLSVVIFRLLGGLESHDKKETLFNIIQEFNRDFPECFKVYGSGICPLKCNIDENKNSGIFSTFTNLFIAEPRSHEHNQDKKIALTGHFCDLLDVIHLSVAVHNPIILEGPPGQGKHTAIEYVANMLDKEVIYITISQSTKVDDLLGKLKIDRKSDQIRIEFTQSKLVETIRSGSGMTNKPIIVIENINNATPAVLNALLAIFNVEIKDILLPNGEIMEKGIFNLIGIFNTQQSTSTRDKLPSSLIYSTIYYVVKEPSKNDIIEIIKKKFIQHARDQNEAQEFCDKFFNAREFLKEKHLPKIFTLNDISKYLLFRDNTVAVFPKTITIMQMIFVYRFFQESLIDEIRQKLDYEVMSFMPSFNYDNSKSYLLIRVTDDQKVLSLPLIRSSDKAINYDATISKIDSLTSTQKYCLIFMACALLSKRACVIQGETSSGKSFMIRLFAELIGAKLNVFQMNTDSSISMLAGQSVLSDRPSAEDVKSFQDYLEIISKIEEINLYLRKAEIFIDKPEGWTPKKFSEMLKECEKILTKTPPELKYKSEVERAVKSIRELMSPVHRFDNKESELIRAMREGEWVLIDGIESAPPEIAEKIVSLCAEEPELNLFECGPEFVFSLKNGKIHKDFQLFITYNPIASKNNQAIDQSFLIKSVSFTLPEVDFNQEASAQLLYGSMINQKYSPERSKEISSRFGNLHIEAKEISKTKVDSFAGDIQFTGRTLKFITQVFYNHNKYHQDLPISMPIVFSIQAFYLNSLLDKSYYDEFKQQLLDKFIKEDPTNLIKKLELHQKNLKQRNHFVLLSLRNIQLFLLNRDDIEIKYKLNKLINDCNAIQVSDVSFIIRHFEDTISIMEKAITKGDLEDLEIKFGSLRIINNLLIDISKSLQKTFKVEHSCLKLNDKELLSEKELSKPLSRFYLVSQLSNKLMSKDCSLLLNSSLHEEVLFKVYDFATNKTIDYLKSLIKFAIDNPSSIDFIKQIFPGHLFSINKNYEFINFLLPIILNSIQKKVHIKICFYDKEDFIVNDSNASPQFYVRIFLKEGTFDISEKTAFYYGENNKSSFKLYTNYKKDPEKDHKKGHKKNHKKDQEKDNEKDHEKARFIFISLLTMILKSENNPILLSGHKVNYYINIAEAAYENNKRLKYNKIVHLSNFFQVDKDTKMVCFAWNLITSLDNGKINAIKKIVNELESHVLTVLSDQYSKCQFSTYENIIEFTKWLKTFDGHLPLLLNAVSNIPITDKEEIELDLIDRIEKEKQFLIPEKITLPPGWDSGQFIFKLDLQKDKFLNISEELNKRNKIRERLSQIKEDLSKNATFKANEDIRVGLIEQISSLENVTEQITKLEDDLKLIERKYRQLIESIGKSSFKDEKSTIVWPTLYFSDDSNSERSKEMSQFEFLLSYSRIRDILNRLKKEKRNHIKILPKLESYKSTLRVSIPLLTDYYIKNDGYPSELINTAHHEANASFLCQLKSIDKEAGNVNEYHTLFHFYDIPKIINERIKRNKLDEDELRTVFEYAADIPDNFNLILPDIKPSDLIYLLVIKCRKNGKDEFKPGPLINNYPPEESQLEKFSYLFTENYSNFIDAADDITKKAYEVFFPDQNLCPVDSNQYINEICKLFYINKFGSQTAKYFFNQLLVVLYLAQHANKLFDTTKHTKKNYKFNFDDLYFLDYTNVCLELVQKMLNTYPSFAVWTLKNMDLLNKLINNFNESRKDIRNNNQQLPFWIHSLRVFSSVNCIEFIPKTKSILKPITASLNKTIFEEISERLTYHSLIDPSLANPSSANFLPAVPVPSFIGTDWLNLVIPNVPFDLSNHFIHMIYDFLQSIGKDPKKAHENIVIDQLNVVVKQIIQATFDHEKKPQSAITEYFKMPIPPTNDKSLAFFFKNPSQYIIDLIKGTFKEQYKKFVVSDSVIKLMNLLKEKGKTFIDHKANIEKSIDEDIKYHKKTLAKTLKTSFNERKMTNVDSLNILIGNYNSNMKLLRDSTTRRTTKTYQDLSIYREKLKKYNVKFKGDKPGYFYDISPKQNIVNLVTEYLEKEDKQKLEIINLRIVCKNNEYNEHEFKHYIEEVADLVNTFYPTFMSYINKNQIGDATQLIQRFYDYISIIKDAQSSKILDEIKLPYCFYTFNKIRDDMQDLCTKIEVVGNEILQLKPVKGSNDPTFKSTNIFQNSYDIIQPISHPIGEINSQKAKYFKVKDKNKYLFEIPVINMTTKRKSPELNCSVKMIKCVIEQPLIPALYSKPIMINIISLVDEGIHVELEMEHKEYFKFDSFVGPRVPIQIEAKIPPIKSETCETICCRGRIILITERTNKYLEIKIAVLFKLIPMHVKIYCNNLNLCITDNKFRVCSKEFFSGDFVKIHVSNIFDKTLQFKRSAFEVEADNEAEKPSITYNSDEHCFLVHMQTTTPKKLHFTLKVPLSQNLIAGVLFNCLIVPFKFFLEVYDYKNNNFVPNNIDLYWGQPNKKHTLHFRVMCPSFPKKVYTKIKFNLPTGMSVLEVHGLENRQKYQAANNYFVNTTTNEFTCTHEFDSNFVFSIDYACTGSCPSSSQQFYTNRNSTNFYNYNNYNYNNYNYNNYNYYYNYRQNPYKNPTSNNAPITTDIDSRYVISAAFSLVEKELENTKYEDSKINLKFVTFPKVEIKNNIIETDLPVRVYDHRSQKFTYYNRRMKISDFSGINRPLIYVTPFEFEGDKLRGQTSVNYNGNNVSVDLNGAKLSISYLKLGTDGSIMNSSTPNCDLISSKGQKLQIQPLTSGLNSIFNLLMKGSEKVTTTPEKEIAKYPIIGQLDTDKSVWFPAFKKYPSKAETLDVIPENVPKAIKYINDQFKTLILYHTKDQNDYAKLLIEISKKQTFDCKNFCNFMLIMLDKDNLRKVGELISSMPQDFRNRAPDIMQYIPPEFEFVTTKNDLLIIYSYNIIVEFARIFEQRYNELCKNYFNLSQSIPKERLLNEQNIVYADYFEYDIKKQFDISDTESDNFKAKKNYEEALKNVVIQPLPSDDKYHYKCIKLREDEEPIPSNIDELNEPNWKTFDDFDGVGKNDQNKTNTKFENPPAIEFPAEYTIDSLSQFYQTCSTAASVLPVFLSYSKDSKSALKSFLQLFDIYKQLENGRLNCSIISESINSFINSFDGAVCRLKKADVGFNFLELEDTKIINRITSSYKNSSEWINIPDPDPITLETNNTWKTKDDLLNDRIKQAQIRLDIENKLSLENNFQLQTTMFTTENIINNDESLVERDVDKETTEETNINEEAEFVLENFAIEDSDDDSETNLDLIKEKKDDIEGDHMNVIRKIGGKINKKNLTQGKAADSMLSNLKEKDGIERVIARIRSIDDPSNKTFTFKSITPENRITDNSLLTTNSTVFPIKLFIQSASHLIGLLISFVSDNKNVRVKHSFPYSLLSVNLLIDCSSYIPEANKMFNMLLLTAFACALDFLHIPYEISVVADQKFRFILKSFEEPHSIQGLQRVLDCVLIQRYRTNYPDTIHHVIEYMKNSDTSRTQRAIFLFSDGIDENLVLVDAWNKQVLNNPNISFGLIITLPKALNNENKTYMEDIWKQFSTGTKKGAASITRVAIVESTLNKGDYITRIATCFKEVLARPIDLQSEYVPVIDEKPIFDYAFNDLRSPEFSIYGDPTGSTKFFVSIEKPVPGSTTKKIPIDKLDISYYRGKTSKLVTCNVVDTLHDHFAIFIHKVTSKMKNIFRSQLETIFKPNKASQTVLSNTGTDFDITALVLNLINPVPDPYIYLEEKGGLIRNYGVTVLIDTSNSCFNYIGSVHSVNTVINILCALSSIEIPCVDVILATDKEPIILCSELPSIHALGEKSSIWPAFFSYITQTSLNECNLEAGIHAAYDLRRMRGIDYSSIMLVLTDGLYMVQRKEKIKEHVLASTQLGINVIGVGIGMYPVGITDIFPQSVFAPNANEIIRAISCCFGDDNLDPLEKILPLLPQHPTQQDFMSIFDKFKEYDAHPIFANLKEKLKKVQAAIDAFSDVYNEEQDFHGKSYKDIKNPDGKNTEMYVENVLQGQKILIVMLYNCDLNLEESPNVCKKILYANPDPKKDECVSKAAAFFGIDVVTVEDYDSAIKELMKREPNGKCTYYACWVISGWKYDVVPENKNPHHVIAFTQCLLRFWNSGGAVVLFAEGDPFTFQTNYFLEQLTFPDGSKTKLRVGGSHKGTNILLGDDEGTLSKPCTFNRSSLEFKKCQRASLAHNLIQIYEGETISYAEDSPDFYKPFIPFSKDSENGISALFYPFDPGDPDDPNSHHTGDIIVDCGYTKLFDKMTSNGTFKYAQNIAGWTAQVEYSLTNHIKPKDYRPDGFEFDVSKYIDLKYDGFEPIPDDFYKDDDGLDVDVENMQTLFAIDTSGSTNGEEYYYSHVSDIIKQYYHPGDLFIIWASEAKFITKEDMDEICRHKNVYGGTYPQTIIDLILKCDPPIKTDHFVLITDGWIDGHDVNTCKTMVLENNVKFKQVELFVIGESRDVSVGAIFVAEIPVNPIIFDPNYPDPQLLDDPVTKKDIRIYNRLNAINTIGKFDQNFDALFRVIKNKMMGCGRDPELENKLLDIKKQIEDNNESNNDFQRRIDALIKMASGAIINVFNNKKITTMLK